MTDDTQTITGPEAEAQKTRHHMFKYAAYVNVGEEADECPMAVWLDTPKDERDGPMPKCQDEDHFHAWVRLPNPFQMKDIAEKARAARARRARSLRDPQSDASVILENELDMMREESNRPVLVEEILDQDFRQDYDDALREVRDMDDPAFVPEDEDDVVPKLYENIVQDQEEYARQVTLPEEQRGEDYTELEKTVREFSEATNEVLDRIIEPKRQQLLARSMDDLVEMVRKARIDQAGTEAYLHAFNSWQWFICTYKVREKGIPNERVWSDFNQFRFEAPSEVVTRIQETFTALELTLAGDRQGNS